MAVANKANKMVFIQLETSTFHKCETFKNSLQETKQYWYKAVTQIMKDIIPSFCLLSFFAGGIQQSAVQIRPS